MSESTAANVVDEPPSVFVSNLAVVHEECASRMAVAAPLEYPVITSTSGVKRENNRHGGDVINTPRRTRAGTMPSQAGLTSDETQEPMQKNCTIRSRSVSFSLPDSYPSSGLVSSSLHDIHTPSQTPPTDLTIVHTLQSLSLRNKEDRQGKKVIHKEESREAAATDMPIRSLFAIRQGRSYSVSATEFYQEEAEVSPQTTSWPSTALYNDLVSQSRPRSSSMGSVYPTHFHSSTPLSSSWKVQNPPSKKESTKDRCKESLRNQGVSPASPNQQATRSLNGRISSGTTLEPTQHRRHQKLNSYIIKRPSFAESSPQTATRSLWVGSIDNSVTVASLMQVFSAFGPIESVRLLPEKECAFVNFCHLQDAVRAKEVILSDYGGQIGTCIARIGFGRTETTSSVDTSGSRPTPSLWLGNIPQGTSALALQYYFSSFGMIDSIRVLNHKSCAFVNFDLTESAVACQRAILANKITMHGFPSIRVGFAKVPESPWIDPSVFSPPWDELGQSRSSHDDLDSSENEAWVADLQTIMLELGVTQETASKLTQGLQKVSYYSHTIPPVPEFGTHRLHDAGSLRDIRKKVEHCAPGSQEADDLATSCLDDIAELCSDYIGNVVVQRLFEKCSDTMQLSMLQRIAPHLAAISIHKNGTWAAQKIIDTITLPEQVQLINKYLKPFIPSLLLDQFGNYAVQGCLKMDSAHVCFLFEAMAENVCRIALGRFGARAMRGCLESKYTSFQDKVLVSASLIQNAALLATNINGVLLLSWLIESGLKNRLCLMAERLVPMLVPIATHKLGSSVLFKILTQRQDVEAQNALVRALLDGPVMLDILNVHGRGLNFIQRLVHCSYLSKDNQRRIKEAVVVLLESRSGPPFEKLYRELQCHKVSS